MTSRRASAMLRHACALSAALLLAACAGHPQKKPTSPAVPTTSKNTPTSPTRKPWKPLGPYTPGGLYAPGVADGAPDIPPDAANLPEPVPHAEPLSLYGNRSPYVVLGQSYTVLPSARGYVERGVASWYGTKFDGRATSSLEPYDMYQFTAAHRTLPLPSYARVTNLENGRSVIVRINDRGPFHEGRLIDLSYAAAIKLGVNVHGTANVEVRGIDPGQPLQPASKMSTAETTRTVRTASTPKPVVAAQKPASVAENATATSDMQPTPPPASTSPLLDTSSAPVANIPSPSPATNPVPNAESAVPAPNISAPPVQSVIGRPPIDASTRGFLQVASYGDRVNAEGMLQRLQRAGVEHAELVSVQINGQTLWRVHVGPFSADEAGRVAEHLDALGFGNPPFFKD